MREKASSAILGTTMAASPLSGCGGSSRPADATTTAFATITAVPATDTVVAPEIDTEAPAADAAPSDDLIVVGYAQVGAEFDWRTANTESSKSAFMEENGYKLIFDDAQQRQENQTKAIRSFIQQDINYIVVVPVVEVGWETALQEAQGVGILVTLLDRMMDVDKSLYECWAEDNFIGEGEDTGTWLTKYLEDQGRGDEEISIVTLQGAISTPTQVGRTEGFANILAEHSSWKTLDKQTGGLTQAKGQEVMESLLRSYNDIDVIVAENDNMAFSAIDVIKATGKTCGPDGDTIIFSFGTVKAVFDAIIAGDLNAAFECNPLHGPRMDEIIRKPEKGETVEKIQYIDEAYFGISMDLETVKVERVY